MPATPQEELLQQRLSQLGKLENQISKLPAAEFGERKSLREDIARQKKSLGEELSLRDAYRQQCAAQQTLESHEKLKASLRAVKAQRPLPREEIAAYHTSRGRCRDALATAGVPAADPLNTQAGPAQLAEKQEELQRTYQALKAAKAALYRDSKVGDPCVPCPQKRFDKVAKTAKIKSLKARQRYNNCGVMSSAQLLNLVSCPGDMTGLDEDSMLDEAMKNKTACQAAERDPVREGEHKDPQFVADMTKPARARFESGGTSPETRKEIIDGKGKDLGISVELVQYSESALGQSLNESKPVILSVGAHYLKPGYDDEGKEITYEKGSAHAITAVDAKYADGKMTDVLISDTGCDKQYWMKASDLTTAIENHPDTKWGNLLRGLIGLPLVTTTMNVSNKPIKTDCK